MDIKGPDKSHCNSGLGKTTDDAWPKIRYYLCYFIKESSAFFMLWVSVILTYGVICAHPNEMGRDEFYRFIFFLQNPVVIVINTLALITALLHSTRMFNLAAKAMKVGGKVSTIFVIMGFWIVAIIVSVGLLLLVFGYFR